MSIRVMVVDDSNFMRKALGKLIASDPAFEIVGLMSSGDEALRRIPELRPDVITLDVEMEGKDGLTTLKEIMSTSPTPVIMFSAYTKKGVEVTMRALEEGAVDFMEKPSGSISMDLSSVRDELIKRLRLAAYVRPKRTKFAAQAWTVEVSAGVRLEAPERSVLAIGSSTGGVQALHNVIPKLSSGMPMPVLIVQHMPPLFTKSLAESLGKESRLKVKEAEDGDIVQPGWVYVAPGGWHMTVRRGKDTIFIHLDKEPAGELLRPSVNVMFKSVAEVYGKNTIGVVLTGMGNDGTEGMKLLKSKGARSIAQDEASCVVYGMPKFIVDGGMADLVLPVQEIAMAIEKMIQ